MPNKIDNLKLKAGYWLSKCHFVIFNFFAMVDCSKEFFGRVTAVILGSDSSEMEKQTSVYFIMMNQ